MRPYIFLTLLIGFKFTWKVIIVSVRCHHNLRHFSSTPINQDSIHPIILKHRYARNKRTSILRIWVNEFIMLWTIILWILYLRMLINVRTIINVGVGLAPYEWERICHWQTRMLVGQNARLIKHCRLLPYETRSSLNFLRCWFVIS